MRYLLLYVQHKITQDYTRLLEELAEKGGTGRGGAPPWVLVYVAHFSQQGSASMYLRLSHGNGVAWQGWRVLAFLTGLRVRIRIRLRPSDLP